MVLPISMGSLHRAECKSLYLVLEWLISLILKCMSSTEGSSTTSIDVPDLLKFLS